MSVTEFQNLLTMVIDPEDRQREINGKTRRIVEYAYYNSLFYRNKLDQAGIKPGDITTVEDLKILPFTTKEELREAYPLKAQAALDSDVVRIHSSSGTTGKPIIIPYTRRDVEAWAEMMARCYAISGVTIVDRVQITPGYGLWTAGIGFQAGAERLGAMAVPMGPGNTEKQLEMMIDLKSTVLTATSSYALLLAEEIQRRGIRDQISLKIGIFGSERWGEKMRSHIEELLGIQTFDIYGLTEIYGPGIANDCPAHTGLHYWDDYVYFEIIDPATGEQVSGDEQGELVVTTINKEGMPLLRYRTRDLTRKISKPCPCGCTYPQIDRIFGRSDDMIKIHGVNIYPGQVEFVLHLTPGLSSEYEITLTRSEGRDYMLIKVESGQDETARKNLAGILQKNIKSKIGVSATCEVVAIGQLKRSEKKTKRVYDLRDEGN